MSIEINSIKFYEPEEISLDIDNALCFYGTSVDDRGDFARNKILTSKQKFIELEYDEELYIIRVDKKEYNMSSSDFFDYIGALTYSVIIIEATTLNIVEILYILYAISMKELDVAIKILYIEPEEYKTKKTSISIDKDFHLSKKTKDFPPIPYFTEVYFDNSEKLNLIAFLGFERKRLGQVFSYEDNIKYSNFIAVLPLPAFNVGWENRTINSHITFFNNSYNFDELRYVSANNPYQVNTLLNKLLKTKKHLTIAPLGTKPNAIGCAIFLVNCKNDASMPTRLIYDFPTRVSKRSNGIGKIQIYNLTNNI